MLLFSKFHVFLDSMLVFGCFLEFVAPQFRKFSHTHIGHSSKVWRFGGSQDVSVEDGRNPDLFIFISAMDIYEDVPGS